MPRSDIACELIPPLNRTRRGKITRCDVCVDRALSEKTGKPPGLYVTVESRAAAEGDRKIYPRISEAIAEVLREMAPSCVSALTVGLGNKLLTADALGCLTLEKLIVTAGKREGIRALAPGVAGVTGIESYDVIKGVVDAIKPDLVIAVDSLCAAKASRIASSFQISDAGITPGSGVKNARRPLNEQTLGTRVISVGVPMVVYASAILAEGGGEIGDGEDMVVTPKDVDIIVEDCASIIAGAINAYGAGLR